MVNDKTIIIFFIKWLICWFLRATEIAFNFTRKQSKVFRVSKSRQICKQSLNLVKKEERQIKNEKHVTRLVYSVNCPGKQKFVNLSGNCILLMFICLLQVDKLQVILLIKKDNPSPVGAGTFCATYMLVQWPQYYRHIKIQSVNWIPVLNNCRCKLNTQPVFITELLTSYECCLSYQVNWLKVHLATCI